MKRAAAEQFLEKHGILHAERVELSTFGYTVWSYRRGTDGHYILNPQRQKEPILDVHHYEYED